MEETPWKLFYVQLPTDDTISKVLSQDYLGRRLLSNAFRSSQHCIICQLRKREASTTSS